MSAMLWRIIYAVIVVLMIIYIVPLFFAVVGFALPGAAWQLIKVCLIFIAVLYVLFGKWTPPSPF